MSPLICTKNEFFLFSFPEYHLPFERPTLSATADYLISENDNNNNDSFLVEDRLTDGTTDLNVNLTCCINLFYLVVCVVDVLNEASNRRLHQDEESKFPGETHHQGDHTHSLDECPEQHVDI